MELCRLHLIVALRPKERGPERASRKVVDHVANSKKTRPRLLFGRVFARPRGGSEIGGAVCRRKLRRASAEVLRA
jgi:hypothetical protein